MADQRNPEEREERTAWNNNEESTAERIGALWQHWDLHLAGGKREEALWVWINKQLAPEKGSKTQKVLEVNAALMMRGG